MRTIRANDRDTKGTTEIFTLVLIKIVHVTNSVLVTTSMLVNSLLVTNSLTNSLICVFFKPKNYLTSYF